jgi:methionyl aminopeptidase
MGLERYVKSDDAIKKMRVACQMVAEVLTMIAPHVQPGVSTQELNDICHDYIVDELKAYPASLEYKGFPKSVCISVNHVVCHGIPAAKVLKKGDILNIDILILHEGYHGDSSRMYYVGEPSIKAKRLCEVTQKCLYLGIELVKPGVSLKAIGQVIQTYAEKQRMSVVREFCGHGVGEVIHESGFQVVHYDDDSIEDTILLPGLTFTIEPMINFGKAAVKTLPDQWTVVTKDHSLSAQWEHTLLVTDDGVEVLTLRDEEIGKIGC